MNSTTIVDPLTLLLEWEHTFDTHESIKWARQHADLPLFAVAVYLVIVRQPLWPLPVRG